MQRYKILVSYDGTDFHGWQIQPSAVTVVSALQKSFKIAFNKEVSLVGASRTDAGVHALGQVAVCLTDLDVDPEGNEPLKPFTNGAELLEGTINMFNKIDPYFGDCLSTMDKMKHLDLESIFTAGCEL